MPRITPLRLMAAVAAAGILLLVVGGLFVAALFAWCLPHFDRSDLVGVYVAKYPTGTETLTLKADGTFLQEVVLKEAREDPPITWAGVWTWDESDQRLRLDNGMPVNNGFGDISPTFQSEGGAGSYPVERKWVFFGQLLLGDRDSAPLWKVE